MTANTSSFRTVSGIAYATAIAADVATLSVETTKASAFSHATGVSSGIKNHRALVTGDLIIEWKTLDSLAWTFSTYTQAPWHGELRSRIDELGSSQDGWKGPESRAPNEDACRHAKTMLDRLATAGISRRPMVGLDFEGTFSFCWFDDGVNGDLTVYDDGTYSFFISNEDDETARADEDRVDQPLNSGLLHILNS